MQLRETIEITGPFGAEVEMKIADGENLIELVVSKTTDDMQSVDVTLNISEARHVRAALALFIAAAEHNVTEWDGDA